MALAPAHLDTRLDTSPGVSSEVSGSVTMVAGRTYYAFVGQFRQSSLNPGVATLAPTAGSAVQPTSWTELTTPNVSGGLWTSSGTTRRRMQVFELQCTTGDTGTHTYSYSGQPGDAFIHIIEVTGASATPTVRVIDEIMGTAAGSLAEMASIGALDDAANMLLACYVCNVNASGGTLRGELDADTNGDADWTTAAASVVGSSSAPTSSTVVIWQNPCTDLTPGIMSSANASGYVIAVEIETAVDATATPAAIEVLTTMPAVTAAASGDATATPDPIVALVALDAATASGGGTAEPAAIVALVALDAAAASGGGTATPAELAVLAALEAVSVSAGSTPAPDPIVAPAALDGPSATGSATVAVAEIAVPVTMDPVAATGSGDATALPAPIVVLAQIDGPAVSGDGTASCSAIVVPVTLDPPTVTGAGTAAPATIAALAALDAPTVSGGAVAAPDALALVVTLPGPVLSASGTVTPEALAVIAHLLQVSAVSVGDVTMVLGPITVWREAGPESWGEQAVSVFREAARAEYVESGPAVWREPEEAQQ